MPAKRPRALRKGYLTSKLARVSLKSHQRIVHGEWKTGMDCLGRGTEGWKRRTKEQGGILQPKRADLGIVHLKTSSCKSSWAP
eukprot:843559-Pelagomonas_calceolata.AAC.1